jgi:hypothetical protein
MKNPHKFFQELTDYEPDDHDNIEMLYRLMRDDVLKSESCFQYFKTLAETPNESSQLSLNLFLTQLQEAQLGVPDHIASLVDEFKQRAQIKKDQVEATAAAQQAQPKGNQQGSIKSAFDPHSQPVPPGQVAPDVPFPNQAPPSSKRCTHLSGKYRKTPTDPNDPNAGYVQNWVDYHTPLEFDQMPNNIHQIWSSEDNDNMRKHWGVRKFTKLRNGVHIPTNSLKMAQDTLLYPILQNSRVLPILIQRHQ